MEHLDIKAISLNQAYRGRRFATSELKKFKEDIFLLLPKCSINIKGKLEVSYIFGISSRGSDGDNLIKAFQDCLAQAYGFNDNIIYKWKVEKVIVSKGEEYIEFFIKNL